MFSFAVLPDSIRNKIIFTDVSNCTVGNQGNAKLVSKYLQRKIAIYIINAILLIYNFQINKNHSKIRTNFFKD